MLDVVTTSAYTSAIGIFIIRHWQMDIMKLQYLIWELWADILRIRHVVLLLRRCVNGVIHILFPDLE